MPYNKKYAKTLRFVPLTVPQRILAWASLHPILQNILEQVAAGGRFVPLLTFRSTFTRSTFTQSPLDGGG